jgi:hypothetical protein
MISTSFSSIVLSHGLAGFIGGLLYICCAFLLLPVASGVFMSCHGLMQYLTRVLLVEFLWILEFSKLPVFLDD